MTERVIRTARGSGTAGNRPSGPRRPARRDVSTSRLPLTVAAAGLVVAAYLLVATATDATDDARPPRVETCYDRVVYHAARLTDC